jgi:hypothetical protein
MAQGEELTVPEQEELSIFDRVRQLGSDAIETVMQSVHEHRQKALAVLAVGSAALGGGLAFDMLNTGSANAASKVSHSCEKYDYKALNFGAAGKAVLPAANTVINAYNHADRSEVVIKKNQSELYGLTYSHLTEVDIAVPSKLKNGASGIYNYYAQFSGKIIPKDMVLFAMVTNEDKSVGVAKVEDPIYDFYIAKTNGDGENPHQGLQWDMQHSYSSGSYDGGSLLISRLANGSEVTGLYAMTMPVFNTGMHQAESVLEDMTKRHEINVQRNLNIANPSVEICS